jgi:hypothetical protein
MLIVKRRQQGHLYTYCKYLLSGILQEIYLFIGYIHLPRLSYNTIRKLQAVLFKNMRNKRILLFQYEAVCGRTHSLLVPGGVHRCYGGLHKQCLLGVKYVLCAL